MADVQSLKRAFDILQAVSADHDGVSLTEVARQVALPKSTVARILSTLQHIGAVERLPAVEGYRIGGMIVRLASQVSYPRSLIAIARPYLQELAQTCGETVSLGIPDGDKAMTVEQIDSSHELQMRSWVGKRLPLYCTSDGKLYLTQWTEERLADYLSQPLERYSDNTITDPATLRQELAIIRNQGYAWNLRERDSDLVSVAAPIQDDLGHIVAAVCLFGPFFRFPANREAEFIAMTVETAHQISTRLKVLTTRRVAA